MYRSVKIAFMLALAFAVNYASAQNNTISPYSKYGIGLYEQAGLGRNLSMCGTGIALRSKQFANNINPASYSSLDSTMVLFDIGVHMDYEYIETHLESGDKLNANISYFSLTLAPSNRMGISFGIMPYTSVGYTIASTEYISGGGKNKYGSYVEGLGGLTRVYLGAGYNLFKNTSLGINGTILFGPKTERQSLQMLYNAPFSVYVENSDYYVGGKLDFGFQQNFELSKKKDLTIGGIFSTPGILRCDRTELETNTFYQIGVVDTVYYDDDDADRYTNLPATYGAGISYRNDRLTLSGDFNYNPLSKLDISDRRSKLLDNKSFSVGCEYIPERLGRNYDLSFRCGASYETGICKIDHYTLNTIRASVGVGFRIKSIRFNTYCMYKRQGTRDNLLVLDQSLRFGINLTYVDYWFHKRRFY